MRSSAATSRSRPGARPPAPTAASDSTSASSRSRPTAARCTSRRAVTSAPSSSFVSRSDPVTWEPLWLSFKIATIATIATAIVGVAFALLLQWKKLPARDLIDAIISVPLVLPPTVLGYYLLAVIGANSALGEAWESVFGRSIVFNFEGAVIAAAVGSLPLVVRSARVGLESIDPNLLDAARTLGASPLRVLFTVTLPLALPGIAAGLMLGFARALGDYGGAGEG